MLYRRFYEHSKPQTLYCSFIRPHLEFACLSSSVWSPYLAKDIIAIERVQKFALRVCLKDWSLEYDEALDLSNLPSPMGMRRDHAGLCYMFNIVHQNMDFENAPVTRRPVSNTHLTLPTNREV